MLARRKDSGYALAHAGVAFVWFSRGDCGVIPPREAFPRAEAAALKAIELDDTLAEAHEVLGLVKCCYEWDWRAAEAEFRRAIDLNPRAEAMARGAAEGGYPGAMHRAAEKMAARSKRDHVGALRIARVFAHGGQKGRALEWLEKVYEERVPGMVHLAVAWDWDGLHDEPRFQELLRRMSLPQARMAAR